RKGRDFETRIDEGTRRVREQQHVALVDRLEPANRGAVEPDPLGKQLFGQLFQRAGKVLPGTRQVSEPQIHHLHAGFLRLPHHVRGRSAGRGLRSGSGGGWLQRRGHRIGLLERSLSGGWTYDATKCQSSTAENSPKRSWISRSDRSRKIQLVVRRCSPFTKCTRPRTAPTSASGCISTNTSHRSSPRFSSPMCLARSWPGKVALMGSNRGSRDYTTLPLRFLPVRFRPQ